MKKLIIAMLILSSIGTSQARVFECHDSLYRYDGVGLFTVEMRDDRENGGARVLVDGVPVKAYQTTFGMRKAWIVDGNLIAIDPSGEAIEYVYTTEWQSLGSGNAVQTNVWVPVKKYQCIDAGAEKAAAAATAPYTPEKYQ